MIRSLINQMLGKGEEVVRDDEPPSDDMRRRFADLVTRRARASMSAPEPGTDPLKMAAAARFLATASRRLGIKGLAIDERSLSIVDAHLDATAINCPPSIARHASDMAAWLGEIAHRSHGLSWSEGVLTDGRVVFDPHAAVRSRMSASRTPMARSLGRAIEVSAIRSAA
jgi:hypothetical protein